MAPTVPARPSTPYGQVVSGVLAYPRGLGLVAERDPAGHASADSRCRLHVHGAPQHIKAIAYVLQPTARLGAGGIQTPAVVAHLETEAPAFAPNPDRSPGGP